MQSKQSPSFEEGAAARFSARPGEVKHLEFENWTEEYNDQPPPPRYRAAPLLEGGIAYFAFFDIPPRLGNAHLLPQQRNESHRYHVLRPYRAVSTLFDDFQDLGR